MWKILKSLFFRSESGLVDQELDEEKLSLQRRVVRLETKARETAEALETIERTVKGLRLEWGESYDKLEHLMARVTKRAKTASKEATLPVDETSGNGEGEPNPPAAVLPYGTHERLQMMRGRHGLLPR